MGNYNAWNVHCKTILNMLCVFNMNFDVVITMHYS
jgi:hypothetical protein